MDYQIREIRQSEYAILSDFLYEAIFIPEGADKPLRSVIKQPELQVEYMYFWKAFYTILAAIRVSFAY